MARLYADENFPHPAVAELRAQGHDVVTAQEAGQANQGKPDEDVLAFAIAQTRAVLTYNRRHFFRLHRLGKPHFGIIACKRDDDHIALAGRIHQALLPVADLRDCLIRVNRPSKP